MALAVVASFFFDPQLPITFPLRRRRSPHQSTRRWCWQWSRRVPIDRYEPSKAIMRSAGNRQWSIVAVYYPVHQSLSVIDCSTVAAAPLLIHRVYPLVLLLCFSSTRLLRLLIPLYWSVPPPPALTAPVIQADERKRQLGSSQHRVTSAIQFRVYCFIIIFHNFKSYKNTLGCGGSSNIMPAAVTACSAWRHAAEQAVLFVHLNIE